jgi:TonB family protein
MCSSICYRSAWSETKKSRFAEGKPMKLRTVLWILLSCPLALAQVVPLIQMPMGRVEILALLAGTSSPRVEKLVKQRGVNFNPSDDYLQFVKGAGGQVTLLDSLRAAGKTAPAESSSASPPSTANGRETEILTHVSRGAELNTERSYKDAAKEFRSALKVAPDNAFLHFALASVLNYEGGQKSEAEAIAEYHNTFQLQPDFPDAHLSLAHLLDTRKDEAGAMTEYREVLRLEPGNLGARARIGFLLEQRGDLDGAISVYQEGLRLVPQYAGLHNLLAGALEKKGDETAAQEQFHIAAGLPPSPETPPRIRVGGQVEKARLIFSPSPVYPPEAKHVRVQGVVRLEVLIGRDGAVQDIKPLAGDPSLSEAAVAAVRMWRYKPTTINGDPVEVVTEVNVNFTFAE